MEELTDYKESSSEESNFDLKAEIFKYLQYWPWILLGCILGGLSGYLYNRYTIPKYRSEASMMVVGEDENRVSGIMSQSGGSLLQLEDNNIQNQIVKLKSTNLVQSVVDSLDLNIIYYIEGNVITPEAYKSAPVKINFKSPDSVVDQSNLLMKVVPITDSEFRFIDESKEFESTHRIGETINYQNLEFTIDFRNKNTSSFNSSSPIYISLKPLKDMAAFYAYNLEVYPKGKSVDVLTLAWTDEATDKSRDFLNELMYQFNLDGVRDNRQVAQKTTSFIQDRLSFLNE